VVEAQFANFNRSIENTKVAMMGNPKTALASARKAVERAKTLAPSKRADIALATALWLEGEALLGTNDPNTALPVVTEALTKVELADPNSKLHGDLLRSRGAIAATKGNVIAALQDYQQAYATFIKAELPRSQALALQDIGQIYSDAGDYDKVLRYFAQASDTYKDDPTINLISHNNRAEVYRKLGKYQLAITEYMVALGHAKKLDSQMLQVRILTNLAETQGNIGQTAAAQASVDQAMHLARNGEAAGWRPMIYGAAARIAALRGNHALSSQLFDHAFAGINLEKSDMSFREYHLAASQTYEKTGNQALALAHFKAYQRLDSEARNLTASIASQLASSQFDFANQNLKIAKLKEDQLQKDIAMERQKARSRTILFMSLGGAAIIILGVLMVGLISVRRSRDDVRAANDNLTQSNTKLEKALQAKTEFLAMTSHEIRTPLNGILGMTQVLLTDRRVVDDLRGRIEVVNSAGKTMKALVDDILDVAKMESGEMTVVSEKTHLAAILQDAKTLWSGQAEAKNLQLIADFTQAPTYIWGDGGRIRQILFNLMSNALKFTLAGAVRLDVFPQDNADGDREIIFKISDSGVGIAPDMHEIIFESFKQVDSGTTRQFSGTGLGLAICKRLSHAMGGDIGVESAMGQGSTFTVTLPLLEYVMESNEDSAQVTADLSAINLMAALPASPDVVLTKMAFMGEASSVSFTTSLTDTQTALASSAPDHLLFDTACLTTDDADPLDGLRELAVLCEEKSIKFSLLLAQDGPVSAAQAMILGASQIILKPIEIDQLLGAMRSLHNGEPELFVAPALMAAA
jgi:signal transduction histidine kinase/CheY-like chemotaxis protein